MSGVDVDALLELARRIERETQKRKRTARRRRGGAPLAVKDAVKMRANHRCEACGSASDLRVHHRVPRSRGGTHDLSNLRLYCAPCEERDHARVGLGKKRARTPKAK